jgi:hypothetical protein
MKSNLADSKSTRIVALALALGLIAVFAARLGAAQSDEADFIPLEMSINALMVALVDHAAHEIWEAGSRSRLSGSDWQDVEQHARQLIASGTLISLGGTGRQDKQWVATPAWQQWARELTDGGLAALAAVEKTDQEALHAAGEDIVDTCVGCHDMFKPELPTEGIKHVPHYQH